MKTEAFVTLSIIAWLKNRNWQIIAFDYPQSGTGFVLHKNDTVEKNKGSIIPDILAVRNNVGLLLENKDRYYEPDFIKVNAMKTSNEYSRSLTIAYGGNHPDLMLYGIGLPADAQIKSSENMHLIDVLFCVDDSGKISVIKSDKTTTKID